MNAPKTPPRDNVFFRLLVVACGLFIFTMFASMATLLSDAAGQQSPVNRFLDAYSGILFAVEIAVILLTGMLAMAVDRRQNRRANADGVVETPPAGSDESLTAK